MLWSKESEDFEKLNDLIGDEDFTISKLSEVRNVRLAFKSSHPGLIDFLINNISDVIDISLGEIESNDDSISLCLFFLTNEIPIFTSQIVKSPLLYEKLNKFIATNENKPLKYSMSFARIMEFIVENSNGSVFQTFPDAKNLFQKLLNMISKKGIYQLLFFITDNRNESIHKYLESINAIDLIFNEVKNCFSAENNMSMESKNGMLEKLLTLIVNIISSISYTSSLTNEVSDKEKIDTFFSLALSNASERISNIAFNILVEDLGLNNDFFEEEEEEEEEAHNESSETKSKQKDRIHMNELMKEYVPSICQYILNDTSFCASKACAADLIILIFNDDDEIPDCIIELVIELFKKVFEQPLRSTLHCLFLRLFESITEKPNISDFMFSKCDIRPPIVNAFKNKPDIEAAYWGHLHIITCNFLSSNFVYGEECDGWDDYIQNTYLPIKEILDSEYGHFETKDKKLNEHEPDENNNEDDFVSDEDGEEDLENMATLI